MKIKRFVFMGGQKYYACGGFEDYIGSFDTKDEAMAAADKWLDGTELTWAHVCDIETGEYWAKGRPEASVARFLK